MHRIRELLRGQRAQLVDPPPELLEILWPHRQAARHLVAAELHEQVAAGAHSLVHVVVFGRAAGALEQTLSRPGQDKGRPPRPLADLSRNDAGDGLVHVFQNEHKDAVRAAFRALPRDLQHRLLHAALRHALAAVIQIF